MNDKNFLSISIPKNWINIRLKYNDEVIMGQSPSSEDYSLNPEDQPFLQGNAEFQDIHPVPKIWCNSAKKVCRENDILLSVRAPIGAINIADQKYGIGRGLCSVWNKNTYRNFLYYLLLASNEYLNSLGTGSIYTAITVDDVRNISIPLPPREIQKQIADFLDKETTRIDTLISRKQKQIELLQEKRQAIITQSVTRGLNPDVKMKDSGVEWIGEIPDHWDFKKSKYVLSYNDETLSENSEPNQIIRYVEISDVYPTEGINGCSEYVFQDAPSRARRIVRLGDVILSTVRTYLKAISPIKKEYQDVVVSTGFVVLRPDNIELLSEYSSYYFLTSHFLDDVVSRSVGVSYPACKPEDIVNIKICIPPIREQDEISKYLGNEMNRITLLERKIQSSIALLKEYRSSLITHAVSGQIDVSKYQVSK